MSIRKYVASLSVLLAMCMTLSACHHASAPDVVRVGTMAGPGTELMMVAKRVAKRRYGLTLKIIPFMNYTMPNAALSDGSLDANVFQHMPFLKAQIIQYGYHLVSIGKTFLYPMGLYSRRYHHLRNLPAEARIAIPNDPSNEARALLLLQKAKLIRLAPRVTINATILSIRANPKHFHFIALGAAQLPRVLQSVALAAINTNYAVPAGLSPRKNALFLEAKNSPYANIIVVRAKDRHMKKLRELVKAYHSKPVLKEAHKLFGYSAIKAW